MSRLTCVAIGLPFLVGFTLLAQTNVPPDLAKAHAEFETATGKGDKATLQRLMTDDSIWINRAGRVRDKKTVIQELQASTGKSSPADNSSFRRNMLLPIAQEGQTRTP